MTPPAVAFRIVDYRPEHGGAFRALNLAWIEEYFAVEDRDRRELDDPRGTILDQGGHILIAEGSTNVLGTVAVLRVDETEYELAKMAVDDAARRQGIGRALVLAAVTRARTLGALRVSLLTHPRLPAAVRLYASLGFVEVPVPPSEYARVGMKMVLPLGGDTDVETDAAEPLPPREAGASDAHSTGRRP